MDHSQTQEEQRTKFMKKTPIVIAILCFILAIAVFVFAEGARAIYSGVFFVMLGAVLLWTARRSAQKGSQ